MPAVLRPHSFLRSLALLAALAGGGAPVLAAALPAAPPAPLADAGTAWLDKVDSTLLAAARQKGSVEFLVGLRDKTDLSLAEAARSRAGRGAIVVQLLQAQAAKSQAGVLALLAGRGLPHRSFWIANALTVTGSLADIEALARRGDVAHLYLVKPTTARLPGPATAARPARSATSLAATTGQKFSAAGKTIEPSLSLVHAPEVWALGYTGQGVVVGDHDIGVEWTHPALKSKYRGWDAATQTATHAYNWRNAFAVDTFCTDLTVPCDPNEHGTHTTGTMVGSDDTQVVGMAPDAQWIACRSLYDNVAGAGTVPTYMDCMEWMLAPYPAGQSGMSKPELAPDVVNNSWGCLEACAPPILQDVNAATKAAGIIQVVSAGNDGNGGVCNTIAFPLAVYEDSFTIGATDNTDTMADFSSLGSVLSDASMRLKPNVVAPGVDTLSSVPGDEYAELSGTSMSGPHVAGQVALILSAEPRLKGRVDEVRQLIERTAVGGVKPNGADTCGGTPITATPNNISGYGRIDALAAVLARPTLTAAVTAPATAAVKADYTTTVTVAQPAAGKIDVTAAKLAVRLPPGVSFVASTPAPATTSSDAAGTLLGYTSTAALAPGKTWSVSLQLKGTTDGSKAVTTALEADQVSPLAGGTATTLIETATSSSSSGGSTSSSSGAVSSSSGGSTSSSSSSGAVSSSSSGTVGALPMPTEGTPAATVTSGSTSGRFGGGAFGLLALLPLAALGLRRRKLPVR